MIRQVLLAIVLLLTLHVSAKAQVAPVVFPQLGHSAGVKSVAFSPDGNTIASGGMDHTVTLWDAMSGRELRNLKGHLGEVSSVAFSPNGQILASSSLTTIKLWDVTTGRELQTLENPDNTTQTFSIAFLPDGKTLASASTDSRVRLWDLASGQELQSFTGHKGWVWSVAASPDGRVLASGGDDHTIRLWDIARKHKLRILLGHNDSVISVAFSPNGKMLASASDDNTIKLWDRATGRQLRSLSAHNYTFTSVAFSPDSQVLASSGFGSTKLWDVNSGRELRNLPTNAIAATSVAFSPNGQLLISGSYDHTIQRWEVGSGRALPALTGYTDGIRSVAVSPDGKLLAIGGYDSPITLLDAASGRQLRTLKWDEGLTSLSFSADGKVLAASGLAGNIGIWDVFSGRELHKLIGAPQTEMTSLAFSPDSKMLLSGSESDGVSPQGHPYTPPHPLGSLKLWDVATGRELRTLVAQTDVTSVAFSADGNRIASGHSGGAIQILDVASGREVQSLPGFRLTVNSIAFSPDSKVLAAGGFDGTRLWDTASGRELHILSDAGLDTSVAFSMDGKLLISGYLDRTVKIWDVASGRELHTGTSASDVNSITLTPDGKTIIAGEGDGSLGEWSLGSGRETVSLIAFNDGSTIAITPEGYFDSSSPAAEEHLNVRVGNRVFGIGSYREKFYRPELVKLALSGGSLTGKDTLASEGLPPTIDMLNVTPTSDGGAAKVTVRITGGGAGRIELFRGDAAVIEDDAPVSAGSSVTRTYTVPLTNGDNEVRAIAFNSAGTVSSNPATAQITARIAAPKSRGVLHAVVIGIQDFPNHPSSNLRYPVADAQLFANTLMHYAKPLFDGVDVRLLITPEQTTRDSLVQTLNQMRSATGPNDEFVFYVASHGAVTDGEYYLITSNFSGADSAHIKADSLSNHELISLLANIPADKRLIIVDTCQAGAITDVFGNSGMTQEVAAHLLGSIGYTVLAATTADENAVEGGGLKHGLFTYIIANGLSGEAVSGKTGRVSNTSLADYVGRETPPLAMEKFKVEQNPTLKIGGQRFNITQVQ